MERKGPDSTDRLLRATRSLAFNRKLLPLVEQSIVHAEKTICSYFISHEVTKLRIGSYEVRMNATDDIQLSPLTVDERQLLPSTIEANHNA